MLLSQWCIVIAVTLWSQWRCDHSDVVITVTLELYVLWCLQSLWRCIRCDVMNDCSCMMACIQCMYLHCVFCCSEQRNHWMVIFIQHVSVVCRAVFLSGEVGLGTNKLQGFIPWRSEPECKLGKIGSSSPAPLLWRRSMGDNPLELPVLDGRPGLLFYLYFLYFNVVERLVIWISLIRPRTNWLLQPEHLVTRAAADKMSNNLMRFMWTGT